MCRAHGNDRWCWRPKDYPFDGLTHIELHAEELLQWAKGIDKGEATMNNPPNWELFNALRKKYHKNQRQKGRRKLTDDTPPMNFAVYLDTQQITQRPSRYPQTPQRIRSRSLDLEPSPVRGFSPREYNTEGLLAYLEWVAAETHDAEYLDLYQSLFREKIGIDLFKRASGSQAEEDKMYARLKKDCLIPSGMAVRLLQLFRGWQTSLADID
jgi:hypothetical protein